MGEPRGSRPGVGPHCTVLHKTLRAGEKPYDSAAQVKTTTIPSSRVSTNSLAYASLTATELEAAFIAYVEVLEDQVSALKYDATVASVQTHPMVGGNRAPPPPA